MATERIYIATPTTNGEPPRLVRAANPAQVYQHLARATWQVSAAGAMEVAAAMEGGTRLEVARDTVPAEQAALPGLDQQP